MNKGFTLIELLVVVLIIGILAAVALPQYQKAVEKSRATEAIQLLGDLANAEEIFLMSSGYYTNDLQSLDMQMPGIVSTDTKTAMTKNYKIQITSADQATTLTAVATRIKDAAGNAASTPYAYTITLTMPSDGGRTVVCAASSNSDTASKATCTSIANGKADGYIEGSAA